MKFKDIKFNFPISNDPYTIEMVGIGEVIKNTQDMLCIKTKIIRSFNYVSNTSGISYYKNPFEEVKFEYYPSIIEIYSPKIEQILIPTNNGKIIFDTYFAHMDFDNIIVFLDVEHMHCEIFPPLIY